MAQYQLKCLHPRCGKVYKTDLGFRLRCDVEVKGRHGPALLKAVYPERRITYRKNLPGVFSFSDWLPTGHHYLGPVRRKLGSPLTYKSEGLAGRLGLKNLYIAFSGYWPKRGANLITRTFKELEAQVSMARYLSCTDKKEVMPLIVASAGNTANGYNLICHLLNLPVYLVTPRYGLDKLVLPIKTKPFLVVVPGDYTQAIELARKIAVKTHLMQDGGVRNVARRAGLGTAVLNAVIHPKQGTQKIFDHYFQAIGSGAGAIAAHEAFELLRKDGRFGKVETKIHIAQNEPFTPIVDAWRDKALRLKKTDTAKQLGQISQVTADTLTNRHPAYGLSGGLYDILKRTRGSAWGVNNYNVFHAARMFRETENVDIGPSAAVTVDALKQAVESGTVKPRDKVLLHITGGGKEIEYSEGKIHYARPTVRLKSTNISEALKKIKSVKTIKNPLKYLKSYEPAN